MRTVNVDLNGKEYPAAYTVRVLADLEDRCGGKPAREALEELLNSGHVRDTVWLLAQLLRAGARIAGSAEPPPDESALLDLIPGDKASALTAAVLSACMEVSPRVRLEDPEDGENPPAVTRRREARTLRGLRSAACGWGLRILKSATSRFRNCSTF